MNEDMDALFFRSRSKFHLIIPADKSDYQRFFVELGVSYNPYVYTKDDLMKDYKLEFARHLSVKFPVADHSGIGGKLSINPNPVPTPLVEIAVDSIHDCLGLLPSCQDYQNLIEKRDGRKIYIVVDFCDFEVLLAHNNVVVAHSYLGYDVPALFNFLVKVM